MGSTSSPTTGWPSAKQGELGVLRARQRRRCGNASDAALIERSALPGPGPGARPLPLRASHLHRRHVVGPIVGAHIVVRLAWDLHVHLNKARPAKLKRLKVVAVLVAGARLGPAVPPPFGIVTVEEEDVKLEFLL